MTQEALKLALEVLEDFSQKNFYDDGKDEIGSLVCCEVLSYKAHDENCKAIKAITAIKQALAQPEQEPVAWMWKDMRGQEIVSLFEPRLNSVPLYTHLPQRTWVGLAKEDRLTAKYMQDAPDGIEAVIDYIEAKLKELNI
jgi:hypothetical protein